MRYHLALVLLGEELHRKALERGASRSMADGLHAEWMETIRRLGERPCPNVANLAAGLADVACLISGIGEEAE